MGESEQGRRDLWAVVGSGVIVGSAFLGTLLVFGRSSNYPAGAINDWWKYLILFILIGLSFRIIVVNVRRSIPALRKPPEEEPPSREGEKEEAPPPGTKRKRGGLFGAD